MSLWSRFLATNRGTSLVPDVFSSDSVVDLRQLEFQQFGAAYAGRVERFQDSAVAHTERIGNVGLLQGKSFFRDSCGLSRRSTTNSGVACITAIRAGIW